MVVAMAIKDSVCGVKGHNIQSLVESQVPIPSTQIVVSKFRLVCTQCGRPLEEIVKERQPITRNRSPKPKAAEAPAISDPPAPPPNLEV
jgi:hypothetical protein